MGEMKHGHLVKRVPLLLLVVAGLTLTACGTSVNTLSQGSVRGLLEYIGGPPIVIHGKVTTPRSGTAGRIFISSGQGQVVTKVVTIDVPKSGKFFFRAAPGRYEIWGGPQGWGYRGCWPTTGPIHTVRYGSIRINKGILKVTAKKTRSITLVCPVA